jgi:Spy/CpxP family protein refolding chaperone
MEKIKKITGITLLIMALAIPAFALGPGMGRGFRPGPDRNCDVCPKNNLTTEQQEKLDELHKAFQEKTADARTEIMKKQIDLNAEINKDAPDLKKAKAIQKDINELQAKITDAHLEFVIEAKKVNPDTPFGKGRGMGRGSKGMRRGM